MIKKYFIIIFALLVSPKVHTQEVYFFSNGTTTSYYDQGIVDKTSLGESTFEFAYPPGLPQYNDKIPCSAIAYKGNSSLKFNYFSSANGNWKVSIYRNDWSAANLTNADSISFYLFSEEELPDTALPLIAIKTALPGGSGEITSTFYQLSDFNSNIINGEWNRIVFPLDEFFVASSLNPSLVKGIIFAQSENNNTSRVIYIDEIVAFKSIENILPVTNLTAAGGFDSHIELTWTKPMTGLTYRIYASYDGGLTYQISGETTDNFYLGFVPEENKNKTVYFRVVSLYQGVESTPEEASAETRDHTNDELLDLVQRMTFRYFWEGAHQATGMALERSNGGSSTAASGATGMGLLAMIVAYEREYRPHEEIKDRILSILDFLEKCDRHHGAWSHWYNADTKKTQPFSTKDDGGDLVETAYVVEGLIALKNYFTGDDTKSVQIREKADQLWKGVEWNWYRQGNQNVLYWHWSPNYGWQMNMKVTGWNECQSVYVMAASSPTFSIPKEVYTQGWAKNGAMARKRTYYGYDIKLSPDWGGPLFWIHYSFLGINPHGLRDQYADYWIENMNTAKIHYEYGIANPKNHLNYSDKNWGLTASDDPSGYTAHQPMGNDNGTISPTAALASMPYTPEESMKALKYFYRERGKDVFGMYGPYDAFNDNLGWVKKAYIGIDQGPIVVMIENHRTGLLWNSVMKDPDVQVGLTKLGFQYQISTGISELIKSDELRIYPNPASNNITVILPDLNPGQDIDLKVFSMDGRTVMSNKLTHFGSELTIDCSGLQNGIFMIHLNNGKKQWQSKFVVRK